MAIRFGCKVCSACRCINRQASLRQKAAPIVPHRPPSHSCPAWSSEARLLDGLLAFVIVMRPSQGQRCQQYDSQRRSANLSLSLSEMLLNPPTSLLHSITLPFSAPTPKSVWMHWGSPSRLPPLLPPAFIASFFSSVHKETLPHLDFVQSWRLRQQLAESAREG